MMSTLMDFVNELKTELKASLPQTPEPVMPKQKETRQHPVGTLYNIHKRSLPAGVDKVVLIGLTQDDINTSMVRLIQRETKRRNEENTEVFYYFDAVPLDASDDEESIYYNQRPLLLEVIGELL